MNFSFQLRKKCVYSNCILPNEVIIFLRFYLFIFRGEGKGRREGEKHQCVVASRVCPAGNWPATQGCALTGNQIVTFWFTGPRSIHWATPARAEVKFLKTGTVNCLAHQLNLVHGKIFTGSVVSSSPLFSPSQIDIFMLPTWRYQTLKSVTAVKAMCRLPSSSFRFKSS